MGFSDILLSSVFSNQKRSCIRLIVLIINRCEKVHNSYSDAAADADASHTPIFSPFRKNCNYDEQQLF